jgi:RNA polymerase sigma-70 factor, ECF subfamily
MGLQPLCQLLPTSLSCWYGGPYLPRRYLLDELPSNILCSADVTHGAASLAHKAGFQTDEKALILAAQKGDQDAFGQLVRAYDQSVLRLAMNLLRSPEDAQDVYQEAFLRVYRNLNNFRFDCSFHTWLYRIVTNLCLDHMRKRKVRKEESSLVEGSDGPVDRMDTLQESRAESDPQRTMFAGELRERIQKALSELSARERMVFELRHYQGLKLRNIGEILGTTEEAAKNCLFRATQKMRVALGDFV